MSTNRSDRRVILKTQILSARAYQSPDRRPANEKKSKHRSILPVLTNEHTTHTAQYVTNYILKYRVQF